MKRLFDIGFQHVGHMRANNGDVSCEISALKEQKHVLYVFAINDEVKYIGKSTRTLGKRLYNYCNPGASQKTNLRINKLISDHIEYGADIRVYAYADSGNLSIGEFHLNVADGLENSLIANYSPEWNILGKQSKKNSDQSTKETTRTTAISRTPDDRPNNAETESFEVKIGKAYWDQGFFNVRVQYDHLFGADQKPLNIYLGDETRPVSGYVNRRANPNFTPRIMAAVALKDWLHRNTKLDGTITVEVISKDSIRLHGNR